MPKKLKKVKRKVVSRSKKLETRSTARYNPYASQHQRYTLNEIKLLQLRIEKLIKYIQKSFDESDISFVVKHLENMQYSTNQSKFNQFGTYLALIETGLESVRSKLDDGQIGFLRLV